VIAHIGGLPVEEILPVLISGGGAWVILRLTMLRARAAGNKERTMNDRRRNWRES
jgi:hypothetical protein